MSKFELGKIVATPGALEVLREMGIDPISLVKKHGAGDWGDLSAEDRAFNEQALVDGSRIFSSYLLPGGQKVWIITEAKNDSEHRESTCILLPEEY